MRYIAGLVVLFALTIGQAAGGTPDRDPTAPAPTVGILLFEGVQIIDFTGPFEVFGQAGMKVWTATVDGRTITTGMGMKVTPDYALEAAPAADILVLPGGNVPHVVPEDDPRLDWIRRQAAEADAVLSVCNGVFYLSSAGLLDGLRATTYALMLDHLEMARPQVEVVSDERVVDNGKIVTAGGLSAGIDGALHLVVRHFGVARARAVANNMEYDWRPESEYLRSRLADTHIHAVIEFFPPMNRRVDEVYEGDETAWRLRWRVRWSAPVEEMRKQFLDLAQEAGWKRGGEGGPIDWSDSAWTFTDREGRAWTGAVAITVDGEDIVLAIEVEREG